MTLSKFGSIFFLLFALIFVACKKGDNSSTSSQSANEIVLSYNGGADIHYSGPSTNSSQEKNWTNDIDFIRSYYTTATMLPQQVNSVEFTLTDHNIFSQTLPYQAKNVAMSIIIAVPANQGTFFYNNSLSTEKGTIVVTITGATGQRLQGTFSGIIYSSYNQTPLLQSITVKGSFDVSLPTYQPN